MIIVCLVVCAFAVPGGTPPPRTLRPPTISPSGGHYRLNETIPVHIRAEAGARIVYTLDGTLPSETHGTRTDRNALTFDLPPGDVVVRAVAVRSGYARSAIRTAEFTRSEKGPDAPERRRLNPPGRTAP